MIGPANVARIAPSPAPRRRRRRCRRFPAPNVFKPPWFVERFLGPNLILEGIWLVCMMMMISCLR